MKQKDLKKNIKHIVSSVLSLSILLAAAGCRKNVKDIDTDNTGSYETIPSTETLATSDEPDLSKESISTKYTGSYEIATPTGTRADSDDPYLPEEIVYWDPDRELKPEYTLKEAIERYAFIVDHTTLIYTACDDLQARHEFYCGDYGAQLFVNFNNFYCLDSNGEFHEFHKRLFSAFELNHIKCSSSKQLIDNLATLLPPRFFGMYGLYSTMSSTLETKVIESSEDYALIYLRDDNAISLCLGRPVGKTWLLVSCYRYNADEELTEKELSDFKHYAGILFEHLSPDDGIEPYIYDKIVNTPFLGEMHISSFNSLGAISGKSICLLDHKDGRILYVTPDSGDLDPEKQPDHSDWEDMGDMKVRKGDHGSNEFYFTMDGVPYRVFYQISTGDHSDFDSSEDLLKFIRENYPVTS